MIGKPEWFKRRKYGGWGVFPKTWQGWVYLAVIIIPFAIFNALPFWSTTIRIVVTAIWGLFLVVDIVHIMVNMKRDERERIHEAIAERNALWAMMLVLVIGIGYETAVSTAKGSFQVDPFVIAAVALGVVVKAVSNFYLDKRD
jgi:hypothetical protein